MADLVETLDWADGVYQIEQTDPVVGGPPDLALGQGIANVQAQQLASRTLWLKNLLTNSTSAAALLAAIKTVDGAGSGLDADRLDGQTSDYFARAVMALVAWDATSNPDIAALVSGTQFGRKLEGGDVSHVVIGINANDSNDGLQIIDTNDVVNGPYTRLLLTVSGNDFNYKGNKIWHSGNDGVGSGLDADAFQGQSIESFATKAEFDALNGTSVDQGDIDAAINALIGGAPGALDTLNELAAAMADDANFAASVTASLAGKLGATATAVNAAKLGDVPAAQYARATDAMVDWDDVSNPDISALIVGSDFGQKLETGTVGHIVVAVNANDVNDGFHVVDTNGVLDNNYVRLLLTVTPSNFEYRGNEIWHEGNDNPLAKTTFEAVGSYAWAFRKTDGVIIAGNLYAGSDLRFSGILSDGNYDVASVSGTGGTLSGSWKAMSHADSVGTRRASGLFVRVA